MIFDDYEILEAIYHQIIDIKNELIVIDTAKGKYDKLNGQLDDIQITKE